MWLKLSGSMIVFAVGTIVGFNLAERYKNRPQQIRQLINGIVALKSYIGYVSMPLAEAFCASSRGVSGIMGEVFANIGTYLQQEAAITPQEAIAAGLNHAGDQLALQRLEQEAFVLFGANLGKMNREEQARYCDMLMLQLEKIEHDALALRDQNVTMYRYLGVCGGMAVIILLI